MKAKKKKQKFLGSNAKAFKKIYEEKKQKSSESNTQESPGHPRTQTQPPGSKREEPVLGTFRSSGQKKKKKYASVQRRASTDSL